MVDHNERVNVFWNFINQGSASLKEVTNQHQKLSNGMAQTQQITAKANTGMKKLNQSAGKGIGIGKGFQFAWLGVMFAGMALYRVFGGLIKQQLEMWGVTELLSQTLSVVFIPLMSLLTPILYGLLAFFMDLPDGVKMAIGVFILLAAGLGLFLMVVGQIMLGVLAFIALWPTLSAVATPIIAGLGASLGLILIIIAVVIAVVAGMYIAWKNNFLGMQQVVQNIVNGIKQWFEGLKQFFGGILKVIKGLFTGDFEMVKEGIIMIFKGLWNMLIGGWHATMNAIKAIVIGAIQIVWNIIKVVIDGIKWVFEKIPGLNKLNPFGAITSIGKGILGSFATGGVVPQTGPYVLHKGETVVPNGSGSGINMNVSYNVTVSDKREFENMLKDNNNKLTQDVRRLVNG